MITFAQRLIESLNKRNKFSNKDNQKFVKSVYNKLVKAIPTAYTEDDPWYDYNVSNQVTQGHIAIFVENKTEFQLIDDKKINPNHDKDIIAIYVKIIAKAIGIDSVDNHTISLAKFEDRTDFKYLQVEPFKAGMAGCLIHFEV